MGKTQSRYDHCNLKYGMLKCISEGSHSEQKERAAFTKDKAALNVIFYNYTSHITIS